MLTLIKIIDWSKSWTDEKGKKQPSIFFDLGEVVKIDGKDAVINRVRIDLAYPKGKYAKNYRRKLHVLAERIETYEQPAVKSDDDYDGPLG